jgi:hypothetical protein
MNDIEILDKVIAYESTHNIEDYVVDGWHVWPLLRIAICLRSFPSVSPSQALVSPSLISEYLGSASRVGKYLVPLRRQLVYLKVAYKLYRDSRRNVGESKCSAEAVFLTLSERRVLFGGTFFEIYTDPFVDILREMGVRSLVWEQGEGQHPQYSASTKILNKLDTEILPLQSFSEAYEEPGWFADYKLLVGDVVGRKIAWGEISPMIRLATNRATVFERWLRRANPKILLTVCWYDPLVMAATMAAKRCGVKTIEIQHGVQGKGHFAYSSWLRAPFAGYEVVPDVFWCWGQAAVGELQEYNPAFAARSSAVAGGNLWINRWRQKTLSSPSAVRSKNKLRKEKRILVSLGLDIPKLLLDAISASPPTWVWMIRFHPSRNEENRVADMSLCATTQHPNIEFEHATKTLLYELLNDCDVHVTECSSIVLEALVFGVQSIILGGSESGETGKFYYRKFIGKALMFKADTVEELIDAVDMCTFIATTEQLISNIFADNHVARNTLSSLLRSSESKEVKRGLA